MKKILIVIMVALAIIFTSKSSLAGGDQVTGANAEGPAYQNGECPFTGTEY
jgi:hypothetical protein